MTESPSLQRHRRPRLLLLATPSNYLPTALLTPVLLSGLEAAFSSLATLVFLALEIPSRRSSTRFHGLVRLGPLNLPTSNCGGAFDPRLPNPPEPNINDPTLLAIPKSVVQNKVL